MMQNQRSRDRQWYRHRRAVVSVLILSVVSVIIVALFRNMYDSAEQNILNIWENNVIQLAKSTEYYLARPADAIEFSAAHVENLIAEGKTNQEIGEYLVREMDNYATLVENNYTGVYGYCRGDYLDASGWAPDADYDPTLRPWYVAAKENAGRVTLVSPFLNLQTGDMMMSISKLLSDGESVLSMDIYMDSLQKTVDDLAQEEGVRAAFIMDGEGRMVVHSERDQAGRNYLKDGDDYQKAMVERARAIAGRKNYYEVGPAGDEIIFAERISGAWCAVLILNEANLLGSIWHLNLILILFLAMAILVWFGISRRIDRKYREAEQLSREVNAVADIYEAMTLVDLNTNRMTVLRGNDELERVLEGDLTDYSGRAIRMAGQMAADESRDMLMQFMDPATYEERLSGTHSVSYDFLSSGGRWLRVQLIVVDRDDRGKPKHIIWAIESIDRERRQQEHLRELAETDALSRLNNRRSGESRIRAMLASGTKGMFILLDIDSFKQINDHFGHVVGDLVITAVADALRRTFRDSDVVFRLGGDEFAVFAPAWRTGTQRGGSSSACTARSAASTSRSCWAPP